jgi:hypothetical protein
MVASKGMVRSPILASKAVVPLVEVVCPSAILTSVGSPFMGDPNLRAMVGLTYDFWACESRSAVTKPKKKKKMIALTFIHI